MRDVAARFLIGGLVLVSAAGANQPPDPPVINEPVIGNLINPEDVHMETQLFSDPDPNDTHVCTDWEIWRLSPLERVWITSCISGVEKVHTHLGDGTFENSYAGRTSLEFDENYQLRVRFRDSSGDPLTEWSDWALRDFTTGSATQTFGLQLDDVLDVPAPTWTTSGGAVVLPGGADPPALILENEDDDSLLELFGTGGALGVNNPPAYDHHHAVRLRMHGGSTGLVVEESTLAIVYRGVTQPKDIYIPSLGVPAGQEVIYWIAASGATYVGAEGQSSPDFSNLARGVPVPWEILEPGYRVDIVATGLQLPVNIAFVPNPGNNPGDPYYYVTELYGKIKVVTRNGQVSDYAAGLINFPPTAAFPGSGEQGLAGLAVDPTNGDVYATRLVADPAPNGPHYPQVIRLPSSDGGLTASAVQNVLYMPGEGQGQSHQVSNISFGPDDKLYVHNGDGFLAPTAQDLDSFRGKILRMNRDGSPATDNPYYNAGDGINSRDYIIAWGLRNPFGGGWRAADGRHYTVENGPSVDRVTNLVPGRNYQWLGDDASMYNFALYNWNPAVGPVNIAFVQPETFGGSGFPPDQWDFGFVTESGSTYSTGPGSRGKLISRFQFDANGNMVGSRTVFAHYIGAGKATAVGLAAGPDGLYFSDLYKDEDYTSPIDPGANILRIRYVGRADFAAEAVAGPQAPFATRFLDQSDVPNATQWSWDFGDGGTSTEQNPIHVYAAPGAYDVRLSVVSPTAGVQIRTKPAFITIVDGGLTAVYFNSRDLTDPVLTRADPQINFQWGSGGPDPALPVDNFSVRWTGQVEPQFSQTYRFYARTDDGARLWVNDVLLVDQWVDQAPTEASGTIALTAGQRVSLKMEYYEAGGGAVAELRWSSPSQTKQIIPASRLFGPYAPADLRVALGTSSDPAIAGQPFTYLAQVSNQSSGPATGVRVQVVLPSDFSVSSVVPDDCWAAPGGMECYLGTLPGGAHTDLSVDGVLSGAATGPLSASATVLSNLTDPNALNDVATSDVAVLRAPLITLDPVGQDACAGENVTLTVAADGQPTPALQWRRDGQPISGETGAALLLQQIDSSQAGDYDVVATNSAGSVTSDVATVRVAADAPLITSGPRSQTVSSGVSVTLSVSANGDELTYQWRRNGQPVPGASAPSLTLNPVQAGDAGAYDVVVTNPCGSATSNTARLRVLERRDLQNIRP